MKKKTKNLLNILHTMNTYKFCLFLVRKCSVSGQVLVTTFILSFCLYQFYLFFLCVLICVKNFIQILAFIYVSTIWITYTYNIRRIFFLSTKFNSTTRKWHIKLTFFSLQFDESTDIVNTAQLIVFTKIYFCDFP